MVNGVRQLAFPILQCRRRLSPATAASGGLPIGGQSRLHSNVSSRPRRRGPS